MSSQARPSFFCTRPNGVLTPLVAVDDLPSHIIIRGVSRTLTAGDTQGMTSCGVAAPRSEPWTIDGTVPPVQGVANEDDLAELQAVLLKIMADDNIASHLRLSIKDILYRGLNSSWAIEGPTVNPMTAIQSNIPGYYGNNGSHKHQAYNSKKEYCSYWIRHGECDYQQQGCLYKHEMPTDPAMLEKLGLRDIPRWYREKFNVASLLQPTFGTSRTQLQLPPPVEQSALKAIQYPVSTNTAIATNSNNHNPHAHRNNRYKSPRGAGFGAGKPRRNSSWNRNGQRSTLAQTVTTNSNETPETSTASPSASENSFSMSEGVKLDIMSVNYRDDAPISAPGAQTSGTCGHNPIQIGTSQHILDKDGMAHETTMADRLLNLTLKDFSCAMDKTAEKSTFRTKSRRLFDFGSDGGVKLPREEKNASAFDLVNGNLSSGSHHLKPTMPSSTANKDTAVIPPVVNSAIRELVETSDPIRRDEVLLNWGPIGEPVQRPTCGIFSESWIHPDMHYPLEPVERPQSVQTSIHDDAHFNSKSDAR
ncbi:hypothetical protein N7462_007884 [Penicillium macrosclerotiorum]|uniref:uncharacterized protein n=1 Tax=Penicillium macrosclerotiorum TaxID=303699 RepID=UPI0025477B7F|nr:uncharacterized protein N7462_007884 [Penicillium macrosclerotiorum]KAJ5679640.1 hypothetical protein N7462_007884 [Penicillium macrosclerotiorum]